LVIIIIVVVVVVVILLILSFLISNSSLLSLYSILNISLRKRLTMVHSKNNDFEDVPGYDIDSPLPITEEDMFNSLNGAQLPPRIRKPLHVHGTTPSPSSSSKKTSKKNTSKKKTAPLANSASTNQCNSNSNSNNQKKRGRKKSSTAPTNSACASFPVSSALKGNYMCSM
jgi:hypothetical protein